MLLNGLDHEHVYGLTTLVVEYIFLPFRLVKFINSCGMLVYESFVLVPGSDFLVLVNSAAVVYVHVWHFLIWK